MKRLMLLLFLVILTAGIVGCRSETTSKDLPYTLYFANADKNGLLPVNMDIQGKSTDIVITNIVQALKDGVEGGTATIPKNIQVLSISVEDKNVVLSFNDEYNALGAVDEILCRSSIVKTLTELDGIESVEFYIGSIPYQNADGTVIGAMKHGDVILDLNEENPKNETRVVTLYFADKDETALVPVETEVTMNANELLELTVLNLLIEGPKDDNLVRTIPAEAKVRNVYTSDGVCYVDFSEEFVTKHMGGSTGEMLTIYSIVNTLTNIPNITQVQFLIEGATREDFKGHYQFNVLFQQNLDLVKK